MSRRRLFDVFRQESKGEMTLSKRSYGDPDAFEESAQMMLRDNPDSVSISKLTDDGQTTLLIVIRGPKGEGSSTIIFPDVG